MKVLHQIIVSLMSLLLLSACVHRVPDELTHISGLRAQPRHNMMTDIRGTAIRETAATLGAQSALAWRTNQINKILYHHEEALSNIFNFRTLLLKHNVMPPILITADNIVNVGNESVIRTAEKMYAIKIPPRFVTATPSWHDYLVIHYAKPETPNRTLLPKNKEETEVWNKTIVKSWKYGVEQADHIFEANLARLKQHYQGMLLYRKLLAQNMVTAPYVAETTLGVTGNQQSLRLNDRILRISGTSALVTDTESWQATLKHLKTPKPEKSS